MRRGSAGVQVGARPAFVVRCFPFRLLFSRSLARSRSDCLLAERLCVSLLVKQYAEICMFTNAHYKCTVAELETE